MEPQNETNEFGPVAGPHSSPASADGGGIAPTELPAMFATTPLGAPASYSGVWPPSPVRPQIAPFSVPAVALYRATTRYVGKLRGKGQLSLDSAAISMSGRAVVPNIARFVVLLPLYFLLNRSVLGWPLFLLAVAMRWVPIVPTTIAVPWELVNGVMLDPTNRRIAITYDSKPRIGLTRPTSMCFGVDVADYDRVVSATNTMVPSFIREGAVPRPPFFIVLIVLGVISILLTCAAVFFRLWFMSRM